MYFTDRLSAPTSSFIPPPVTETGGAGYLPDCKRPTETSLPQTCPLTYSTPIMVSSRRSRDLSGQWRLGHDPSYTPYPNRRSTGSLEIPNHYDPSFDLFKPLATPRPRSYPHVLARRTIVRHTPHSSTESDYRIRVTGRQSSSYPSHTEPNGGD